MDGWLPMKQRVLRNGMVHLLGTVALAVMGATTACPTRVLAEETARVLPAGPLSKELRALLWQTPEDPAPEKLLGVSKDHEGQHFVAGNETGLHFFEPRIARLGGAYVGVGADQAYVLMGWARPEVAWLMDYDMYVVRIHKIHLLFFGAANSPDDYLRLWSEEGTADAGKLIRSMVSDAKEQKLLLHRYRQSSGRVYRRLRALKKKLPIPFYLTDQQQFEHIQSMHREGRIRPMRANLLAAAGMRGIGEAAKSLGVPVRVVYLSNAEQYWDYGEAFRSNFLSLPTDERSVILRTRGSYLINRDYRYIVQPLQNFQENLKDPAVTSLKSYLPRPRKRGEAEEGLVEFLLETPAGGGL